MFEYNPTLKAERQRIYELIGQYGGVGVTFKRRSREISFQDEHLDADLVFALLDKLLPPLPQPSLLNEGDVEYQQNDAFNEVWTQFKNNTDILNYLDGYHWSLLLKRAEISFLLTQNPLLRHQQEASQAAYESFQKIYELSPSPAPFSRVKELLQARNISPYQLLCLIEPPKVLDFKGSQQAEAFRKAYGASIQQDPDLQQLLPMRLRITPEKVVKGYQHYLKVRQMSLWCVHIRFLRILLNWISPLRYFKVSEVNEFLKSVLDKGVVAVSSEEFFKRKSELDQSMAIAVSTKKRFGPASQGIDTDSQYESILVNAINSPTP